MKTRVTVWGWGGPGRLKKKKKMKTQVTDWEKVFSIDISERGYYPEENK